MKEVDAGLKNIKVDNWKMGDYYLCRIWLTVLVHIIIVKTVFQHHLVRLF